MSRVKAILAAGTLTGLVLITILALSLGNSNRATAASQPAAIVQPANTASPESLQAYNAQLEQALQTMQAREAQYQAQIESANQTITQLQNQPQVAPAWIGFAGEGEREEHDD